MRIPIYRSKIQATSEAPGSAIRTRKSAQPFIQAQLDKGKPGQALTNAIGNYALYRYNMAEQLKLDEAVVESKNKLRDLAFNLSQMEDTTNILDGDNPLWFQKSNAIKKQIQKKLGKNKTVNQKFNASFLNDESNLRFSLRGDITEKAKTKTVELNKAKKELIKLELSNTFASADQYNRALDMYLAEEQSKMGVNFDAKEFAVGVYEMQKEIAAAVGDAFVANNADLAFQLIDLVPDIQIAQEITTSDLSKLTDTEIEELTADTQIAAKNIARFIGQYGNGAQYLVHTLSQLNEPDVRTIVDKLYDDALQFEDLVIKFETNRTNLREEASKQTFSNFVTIDENETFSKQDIINLIPMSKYNTIAASIIEDKFAEDSNKLVSSVETQKLIYDVLKETASVTFEQLNTMEKMFLDNAEPVFAPSGDVTAQRHYLSLFTRLSAGTVNFSDIVTDLANQNITLTQTDFEKLKTLSTNLTDTEFSNILKATQFHYKTTDTPDTASAFELMKRNSYFRVSEKFIDFYVRADKTKLQSTDLFNEMQKIRTSQKTIIVQDATRTLQEEIKRVNEGTENIGFKGDALNALKIDPNLVNDLPKLRENISKTIKANPERGGQISRDLTQFIEFIEELLGSD